MIYTLFAVLFLVTSSALAAEAVTDISTDLAVTQTHEAEVVKKEKKITYQIGKHAIANGKIYCAAAEAGAQSLSISHVFEFGDTNYLMGYPICGREITINDEVEQEHPLFDKKIDFLSDFMGNVIATSTDNPAALCYVDKLPMFNDKQVIVDGGRLCMVDAVCDAQGNPTSGLLASAYGTTLKDRGVYPYLFLAVKPHDGLFGAEGSGIAIVKRTTALYKTADELDRKTAEELDATIKKAEEDGKNCALNLNKHEKLTNDAATWRWKSDDPNRLKKRATQDALQLISASGESDAPHAYALDKSAVSIDDAPFDFGEHVTLCWNPYNERLYIGLEVKTGTSCSADQGAHALCIARLVDEKLHFDSIIDGDQQYVTPVSAMGPHSSKRVISMKPMKTTTNAFYMIAVVDEGEGTPQQVIALPLVHDKDKAGDRLAYEKDTKSGKLASATSSLEKNYTRSKFVERTFKDAACDPSSLHYASQELYISDPVRGSISSLEIVRDAVIITLLHEVDGMMPGIYQSQPIFDGNGTIAQWTAWRPVAGCDHPASGIIANADQGAYRIIPDLTQEKRRNIYQTKWKSKPPKFDKKTIEVEVDGKKEEAHLLLDLPFKLTSLFPRDEGGIRGFFTLKESMPGVGRMAGLIATGMNRVVLMATGYNDDGTLKRMPQHYRFDHIQCVDSLSALDGVDILAKNVIECTGGALEDLGIISSADIVQAAEQAWLVVAGTKGIAVLADPDGNGWLASAGIGNNFASLRPSMAFKKIGNHTSIRKIMANDEYLYVMTDNGIDRVTLDPEAIKHDACDMQHVVSASLDFGGCMDFLVSGPALVVGTTRGLFINESYSDVRMHTANELSWKSIEIPHFRGFVHSLQAITQTGHAGDFAHGAQLYVTTGAVKENSSYLYRFYIDNIFEHGIKEETVQRVPDFEVKEYPNDPFLVFKTFRKLFATDGAHYFSAHCGQKNDPAYIELVSSHVLGRTVVDSSLCVGLKLPSKKAKVISAIVQEPASGNWLIATDVGVVTNSGM